MSEIEVETVAEGFERLPDGLGFIDAIQPVYRRVAGDQVSLGLRVEAQHVNSLGICHGGVLLTLADMAGAAGINFSRGEVMGSPTINLSLDFISSAKLGEWIQADVEQVNAKRRFGFSKGAISNRRGVVANFSGTFYFPDHDGMWQDGRAREDILKKFES